MESEPALESLFDHRLLIVSGKGGVGKTTLSLALALIAVEKGKKVLIAELNSEEQVAQILERPPVGYRETELLPGLWGINIEPKKAFEEYVLKQIKFKTLYKAIFENRYIRHFIEATPGLADLMSIGKVYSLVNDYDLVIVDAPATGHGIALLEIPSIVADATRIGPLRTESERINILLHDKEKTKVVIVTLPEEMPVTEAIEMHQTLTEKLKLSVGPIFLNQFQTEDFTPSEEKELKSYFKESDDQNPPMLAQILQLLLIGAERSQKYKKMLQDEMNESPVISIPFIYSPRFGLSELQTIAEALENNKANGKTS